MNTEAATPEAETPAAASDEVTAELPEGAAEGEKAEGEAEKKKPLTLEQLQAELEQTRRDNKRMQRGIDRRTRQLAEERARHLTPAQDSGNNEDADDSEPLSLTKSELDRRVRAEAEKLAPTLRDHTAEVERRQGVIASLSKTFGAEKFDQLASDLDDALGGLADHAGRPKPAIEAVFEADNPAEVIEYLADPEHSGEADSLARMSPVQAGKAIARLEDKLKAAAEKAKPKPSLVPEPLERIRGTGGIRSDSLQDLDGDDFNQRRREMIAKRR